MGRRFFSFLLLCLLFLGIANLRVHFQSRAEFIKANKCLKKERLKRAVRHYSHVIRWYTPFNRYTPVAIRRIHKIGKYAYDKGEWELALFCFQQLRNSLASLRSFYQPYKEGLDESHRYLSLLFNNLPSNSGRGGSPTSVSAGRRQLFLALQKSVPLQPVALWGLALSFLLWVLGLLFYLWWPRLPVLWGRVILVFSGMSFCSWIVLFWQA